MQSIKNTPVALLFCLFLIIRYISILDENCTKAENSHRYVEVEVCNEHSIDQFRKEIANADIYNKLHPSPNAKPICKL